jgi:hypothetical protein
MSASTKTNWAVGIVMMLLQEEAKIVSMIFFFEKIVSMILCMILWLKKS